MAPGRVVQVNVSAGGVPKRPISEAWVGREGLAGDGHNDRTEHGGPHRAVCLYAIEAIERLQSDGHPVEPGSVGENLTTIGVEWSLLPVGTRARIGAELMLELASSTTPCSTQRHNFRDGRFSRISIDLHPSDSRMYARVLAEGLVRPGDEIEILPPAPDSRAADELLLARLDHAVGRSALAGWRVTQAVGQDVRIVADGELLMAAAPGLPGPRWNQALGLARLPRLIADATRFFDEHGTPGWLVTESPLWPGARADQIVGVFSAHPAAVGAHDAVAGLTIRPMTERDLDALAGLRATTDGTWSVGESVERAIDAAVLELPHSRRLLAELDGRPVGIASLHLTHATGWLRGAYVVPSARGRGIQRALIAARAQLAEAEGADLVGAWAELDGVSAANMVASGFKQVGVRQHHRYVPAGVAA